VQVAVPPPLDSHRRKWARPGTHRPWDVDTCRPVRRCPSATLPQRLWMTVSRPAACPPDDDDGDCGCCDDDAVVPLTAVLVPPHSTAAVAMAVDKPAVHPTMVAQHWQLQQQPPQPQQQQRLSKTMTNSSCSLSGPRVVQQRVPHS